MFHKSTDNHAYVPIKIEPEKRSCNISHVDCLEKRSDGFRNNIWNKRWVITSGSFLIWYKHSKYQGDFPVLPVKCQGCFPLQGALITPGGKHGKYFHFDISHPSNITDILSFRSESLKSIETWIKILTERSKVEWSSLIPQTSFTSKSIKNIENILCASKAATGSVTEELLDVNWAITEAQERVIKRFKVTKRNSRHNSIWQTNIAQKECTLLETRRRARITKNLLQAKCTQLLQYSDNLVRRAKTIERFCSIQSKKDYTSEKQRALFHILCKSISIEEEVERTRVTLLSFTDAHSGVTAPNQNIFMLPFDFK